MNTVSRTTEERSDDTSLSVAQDNSLLLHLAMPNRGVGAALRRDPDVTQNRGIRLRILLRRDTVNPLQQLIHNLPSRYN
jgi:hypothetical protein